MRAWQNVRSQKQQEAAVRFEDFENTMTHVSALNLSVSPHSLSKTMKVLICAGGTGGGIYPALAAVSALESEGLSREQVLWIGTSGEMEETLIPRSGIQLETIRGGAIVGVPLTGFHSKCSETNREYWQGISFDSSLSTRCDVYDRRLHGTSRGACRQAAARSHRHIFARC